MGKINPIDLWAAYEPKNGFLYGRNGPLYPEEIALILERNAAFNFGGAVELAVQAHREWLLTTEQPANLYLLKEKIEQIGKRMAELEALLPKKEGK